MNAWPHQGFQLLKWVGEEMTLLISLAWSQEGKDRAIIINQKAGWWIDSRLENRLTIFPKITR